MDGNVFALHQAVGRPVLILLVSMSASGTDTEHSEQPPARGGRGRARAQSRGRGARGQAQAQPKGDVRGSKRAQSESSSGTSTPVSDDDEAARIATACQALKQQSMASKKPKAASKKPKAQPKKGQKSEASGSVTLQQQAVAPHLGSDEEEASTEDSTVGIDNHQPQRSSVPRSSSMLQFARHLVQHVLTVDEQSKLKRLTSTQTPLTMGEFCAGMGTGTIAAAGLSRVVQEALGCRLDMSTVFYTEMVPWKQEVIKRVHGAVDPLGPSPVIFRKTGDLAALANPLQCELACKAIECDDISALSPTPRSVVDEAGRSGSSFVEFVAYLARLALDSRPKFILVECVANLAKLRKAVQEQGTVVVSEKLKSLGYQGKWQEFWLQQHFLVSWPQKMRCCKFSP